MSRARISGIGSNLGDRLEHLQPAVDWLDAADGCQCGRGVAGLRDRRRSGARRRTTSSTRSSRSRPTLDPYRLLQVCAEAEAAADRVREIRWGPRTLDVDVLLFGDQQLDEPDLTIPHPRMFERAFVLAPLHDLDPALVERPEDGWPGVRRAPVALRPR